MVMLFVFAHMGRPDRLWHMVPPWGIYSFSSMLGWDVLVLNGYLLLNCRRRLLVPVLEVHAASR